MSNQNDEKILQLKSQIEAKKQALAKIDRFAPATNCVLHLDGTSYNLNVVKGTELTGLLIRVNSLRLSAKDLGVEDYKLSGYSIDDWMADIKGKLAFCARADEEAKLKTLEQKLHDMLSTDKKVELEIESIADMLK